MNGELGGRGSYAPSTATSPRSSTAPAEEERELLLQRGAAVDVLPQMRDALPYLVELVGAPRATARQHRVELIAVEQHEHRLRG